MHCESPRWCRELSVSQSHITKNSFFSQLNIIVGGPLVCFQAARETLSIKFHGFKFFLNADGVCIFISGSDFSLEVQNHIANCLHIPIWISNRHLQPNIVKQTMSTPHVCTLNLFLSVILISVSCTTIHTVVHARLKLAVTLESSSSVTGWILWKHMLRWSLACKIFIRDQHPWKEEGGGEIRQRGG